MATSPTTAWARAHGLVTAGKKAWAIEFRILANNDLPGSVSSRRGTELWMRIASDHFWVDFQHAGNRFSYVKFKGSAEPKYTARALDLPDPELATFGAWFSDIEARFRRKFPRKRMWVLSNIKGGRDAIVAWIERGFVTGRSRTAGTRASTSRSSRRRRS